MRTLKKCVYGFLLLKVCVAKGFGKYFMAKGLERIFHSVTKKEEKLSTMLGANL